MGQYFVLVNHDRREVVCPWCVGGVAKLWEWCMNPQAGLLPYLLRKSTGTGGGDIPNPEGVEYAGRWAGEKVELVGDYDESGDFQRALAEYTNISPALAAEYNGFIGLDEVRLRVGHCGCCGDTDAVAVGTETVEAGNDGDGDDGPDPEALLARHRTTGEPLGGHELDAVVDAGLARREQFDMRGGDLWWESARFPDPEGGQT